MIIDLPNSPLSLNKLSEPVTINSLLTMEEHNEVKEITSKAGTRNSHNNTITRQITGTTSKITIHEKVCPRTMIGKEHGFSRTHRLTLLYDVNIWLKNVSDLRNKHIPIEHTFLQIT